MGSDMDEILEEYGSLSDIDAALEEKAAGEFVEEESLGEMVRDYPTPQRTIDLHGMTGQEAKREIETFVASAQRQRLLTVEIVTGKGLHSVGQQSVLPEMTESKLSEMKRQGIVFNWKRGKNGGSFIVYLT